MIYLLLLCVAPMPYLPKPSIIGEWDLQRQPWWGYTVYRPPFQIEWGPGCGRFLRDGEHVGYWTYDEKTETLKVKEIRTIWRHKGDYGEDIYSYHQIEWEIQFLPGRELKWKEKGDVGYWYLRKIPKSNLTYN